jgi:hypothetical protein
VRTAYRYDAEYAGILESFRDVACKDASGRMADDYRRLAIVISRYEIVAKLLHPVEIPRSAAAIDSFDHYFVYLRIFRDEPRFYIGPDLFFGPRQNRYRNAGNAKEPNPFFLSPHPYLLFSSLFTQESIPSLQGISK